MNVIKDAVHNDIRISDFELSLLDSWEMQRLRRIRQLAITHLVYPGANHSRFEHSLGCMELAGRLCSTLGLDRGETEKIRAAALLHDVGHIAFSHEIENILEEFLGKSHEEISQQKASTGELADLIRAAGFSPSEIAKLIGGAGRGQLITSQIGSDRMDYLLRDSHYTGVAYGVIDASRIISKVAWKEGKLVLHEGALEAAEGLLIARFLMFSTVYLHHAVRIASRMLYKAVETGLRARLFPPKRLLEFDDAGLVHALSQNDEAAGLLDGLMNRRLYKRALEVETSKISDHLQKKLRDKAKLRAIEKEIAEAAGLPEASVAIDLDSYGARRQEKLLILEKSGALKAIEELSPVVKSIQTTQLSRLTTIVSCPSKSVPEVQEEAKKVLGL